MKRRTPWLVFQRLFDFSKSRACFQRRYEAATTRSAILLLFLGVGLALVRPCEGESPAFVSTGNLGNERSSQTATLLPDGKVLVAGGVDRLGGTSAELYDPATETWTATGSLVQGRTGHTATLLPDGRVLVVGGANLICLASAELYDPASGTWTMTGSLAGARAGHTATLLPNGKLLVAGGFFIDLGYGGFPLETAELYDPASGTWTATGSLATARSDYAAVLLPNGKVLVAGGSTYAYGFGTILVSSELYDSATETWTATGSLITARADHTATLLPNGQVLVVGGFANSDLLASAELYDPVSELWTSTGNLAVPRLAHTATLLPGGSVLVMAGLGSSGVLGSAELFDPVSETWSAAGELATARFSHTATLLPDSNVLVAGGVHSTATGEPLNSAELYVGPPPTLLNISTRLGVESGDNVMIGGFIITGTQPKTVIFRGIGPSLAMPGALADPVIEVHDSSGAIVATNDNWKDDPNEQHVADSGLAPSDDLESALWEVLDPGPYTVILRGQSGGTGVGLVEAYEMDRALQARVANISTRGLVQTDDNVLIGGFIVGGGTEGGGAHVVVRALGPSVPVTGALGDPTLELHDGSGTLIDSNDDWKTRPDGSSQQAEVEATTIPPTHDLESALVETLPAGNYTAIVRGKNVTTGVGLVEVYNLP